MDNKILLFRVNQVGLKAPKLGDRVSFWFLELYISGSTNLRKVVFYKLKLLAVYDIRTNIISKQLVNP